MKGLLIITTIFVASISFAGSKNCTDQPKEKWMTVEAFKKLTQKKGFKIRKFKQPGSCYEIYGKDKDGREVEVYFNPVDGSIVKIEFED